MTSSGNNTSFDTSQPKFVKIRFNSGDDVSSAFHCVNRLGDVTSSGNNTSFGTSTKVGQNQI